jgi:predicted negative regulator of RcsB-dependent stress response
MNSETTESAKFYEVLAWLEANKKTLAIGAGVLLLVGFVIYFLNWRSDQRELRANAALLEVGYPAAASTNKPPPSAYLKVAADYAGTHAGERALLLGAGALFSENRFGEAMTQFKKFQADYPSSPALFEAALGVAKCLEGLDKLNEALSDYKGIIARYPVAASQAKLDAGRLSEALNQSAEAYKYYKEVATAGSRSVWSAEASQFMELLLVKHPELAATNAPVATPAPAAATTGSAPVSTPKTTLPAPTGSNLIKQAAEAAVPKAAPTNRAPIPAAKAQPKSTPQK